MYSSAEKEVLGPGSGNENGKIRMDPRNIKETELMTERDIGDGEGVENDAKLLN